MDKPQQHRTVAEGIDLAREYEGVTVTLESIGLSHYEAKVYVALVAHGFGSADTIAETARIPRTSAYKTLQALCEKGYAVASKGRPAIYKPEPPKRIRQRVVDRLGDAFDKLDLLHEVLREKGEPQLVYTIYGKEKVLEKIGELLDKSTEYFILVTPTMSDFREALHKKFESARERGIHITVITEPAQRVPEGVEAHRRTGLVATDVISDGGHALIAAPDLAACGYTENEALAMHMENFVRILLAH